MRTVTNLLPTIWPVKVSIVVPVKTTGVPLGTTVAVVATVARYEALTTVAEGAAATLLANEPSLIAWL